jgi:molybdenum cofactor cytidylyltransferase
VSGIAALVLAAGLSRRFGPEDKLAAPLDGKPLAAHIAGTLGALPFVERIAVCSAQDGVVAEAFRSAGFTVLVNPAPEQGQGRSLAIGASYAASFDIDGLLVALADMPFVSPAHVEALKARFAADPRMAVASTAGDYRGPPALFPRASFAALMAMSGDAGAKRLLNDAAMLEVDTGELRDFDTPDDFGR